MRGGARKGAGRKPSPNPTKPVSIRMTQEQHAEYIRRGGAKWLKSKLVPFVKAGHLGDGDIGYYNNLPAVKHEWSTEKIQNKAQSIDTEQ